MNYNEQYARFWRLDATAKFSPSESHLFTYLLHVCQRKGWANPFEHGDAEARAASRLPKQAFRDAIKRLTEAGLLQSVAGTGRGNVRQYTLLADKIILTKTLTGTPKKGTDLDPFPLEEPEKGSNPDPFSAITLTDIDEIAEIMAATADKKGSDSDPFSWDLPERGSNPDPFNRERGSNSYPFNWKKGSNSDPFSSGPVPTFFSENQAFTVDPHATGAEGRMTCDAQERDIILNNLILIPGINYNSLFTHTYTPPPDPLGRSRVHIPTEGRSLLYDEAYTYSGLRGYSKKDMRDFIDAHAESSYADSGALGNAARSWLKARKDAQGLFPPGLGKEARRAHFVAMVTNYEAQNPGLYDPEMYVDFIDYYTESSEGSSTMVVDGYRHFDLVKRLRDSNKLSYLPKKARQARMTSTNGNKQFTKDPKSAVSVNLVESLTEAVRDGDHIPSWVTKPNDYD